MLGGISWVAKKSKKKKEKDFPEPEYDFIRHPNSGGYIPSF